MKTHKHLVEPKAVVESTLPRCKAKPKAPNRHQTARYRGAQIEKTFRNEYKVISDGWKYFPTFREALAYIDRKRAV